MDSTALEKIRSQYPSVTPKILLALAIVAILTRSVTPQRVCACGCGAFVTGKAHLASPACRKRAERQRRAAAGTPGRQFSFPLQDEIPI